MGHSESKPGATVLANVKTVTKPDSQWHEPVYYALCASGGGSRALTYTMGIYRGLNELNLIPKLDAISSVSGGTWCSSIFVFAKTFKGEEVSTGQLVGAPVQPSSLSMTELESTTVGAIASGIVLGDSDEILAKTGMEFIGREWETWPHVMSRWLLRDFDGVKDMNAYLALDDDSIQRIKKNNPQLEKKTFITPRSDRPKMYIINGTMLAPLDKLATNENVVTFQMGADYIGSPFYPDNQQVSYHRASFCPNGCECMYSKCGDVTRTVGGGFVESFAFGGTAPTESLEEGVQEKKVGEPKSAWALPYCGGMSSWAPGGFANASSVAGAIGNMRSLYWPLPTPILPMKQDAITYEFGDGGLHDNSGFLALVQRKASRVIWVASAFTSFSTTYDWDSATVANFNPSDAGVIDQLYVLFGYNTTSKDYYYANDQIFAQDLCLPMCQELRALMMAGKPAVLKKKLPVQENTWWGISGGWEVEFVILYLATSTNFESQLPEDTQQEIAKGDKGAFAHYPIYATEMENGAGDSLGLTTAQVNLLAAQGEYSVQTNAQMFIDLLS